MQAIKVYGIKACDTVKKARSWLESREINYIFHDYKIEGVTADMITHWVDQAGWEAVLNRNGTTFRKLPEADRLDLDAAKATGLMTANPSTIKRPIIDGAGPLILGFNPDIYERAFRLSV
ncbi:MAG: ArsC family reductase [Phenylobacterium zucineum]|nr:MAG: ArsC family reductase [Phenylobacterium zucineum]